MNYKWLLAGTILLTGCSNESDQLKQEKTKLQSEINHIKENINSEKTKAISKTNTLNDLNNQIELVTGTKNTMSNEEYANIFTTYSNDLTTAFADYANIDSKVKELKKDSTVSTELSDILSQLNTSISTFNHSFDDKQVPSLYKEVHEQVTSANTSLLDGMKKIKKAYQTADQKLYEEGSSELNKGISQFDTIQFQ